MNNTIDWTRCRYHLGMNLESRSCCGEARVSTTTRLPSLDSRSGAWTRTAFECVALPRRFAWTTLTRLVLPASALCAVPRTTHSALCSLLSCSPTCASSCPDILDLPSSARISLISSISCCQQKSRIHNRNVVISATSSRSVGKPERG
jgi:hypothetical protein